MICRNHIIVIGFNQSRTVSVLWPLLHAVIGFVKIISQNFGTNFTSLKATTISLDCRSPNWIFFSLIVRQWLLSSVSWMTSVLANGRLIISEIELIKTSGSFLGEPDNRGVSNTGSIRSPIVGALRRELYPSQTWRTHRPMGRPVRLIAGEKLIT